MGGGREGGRFKGDPLQKTQVGLQMFLKTCKYFHLQALFGSVNIYAKEVKKKFCLKFELLGEY